MSKPANTGLRDVGPVAGFAGPVTSGGRYDVAITTTDGPRWRGPAFAIWYSRQLLGDGPLEKCEGTRGPSAAASASTRLDSGVYN